MFTFASTAAAVQNSSHSASNEAQALCVTVGRESGLILCEWREFSQKAQGQESLLSLSAQHVGYLGDQGGHPHTELAWELTRRPRSQQPVCFLQAQAVQLNKEMTLASNRSLAEGNLLYQPQLDAQKARLTQKYQELQALFEAYQIKKTKLGNFFQVIFEMKELKEG